MDRSAESPLAKHSYFCYTGRDTCGMAISVLQDNKAPRSLGKLLGA